ncbi:MAG: S-layer homology domain-containing protein, partial [Clostridia bacterium]|nr:S-layer homology domain-containing protein [Clostridia bacterium]
GGSVVGISGEYGYGIGCGRYVEGSSISIGSADVSAFSEEGTSAIELDAITGSAIVFSGKFLSDFYSSDETFTFTCGSYQKQITFPAGCKYFSTTLSQQGEYSISDSNGAFTGKLDSTYVSTFSVTSGYDIFTVYPSVEYTLSEPTLTVDDIVLSSSQTTKSITLSAKSASVTMAENAKGSKPSVSYSYAIKEDSAKIASLSGSKLTVTVSKAGNYSIVVTATATAGALQTSVDATINVIKQNQTINLSNIDENVTISSNGVYTITGSTTRYNVNVNSALDDVTLVLSGATIDLSKNSGTTTTPIIVGAGSSVTLISSGTTTLKNRIKGTPIKLEDGDSSYPTKLFVKSSGKLYMENEYTGVGILGGGSNTQVYMLTGNARITTVDGAGISVGNLFVSDLSYMKILTESSKVKPVIATMITDDYDDYTAAYVLQANLSKSLDVSTTTLTVKNSDTKKYITIDDFLDDYMGFAVVLPSSGVYTVKYENGDIDRYLTHTMEKTVVLREFTVDEYLDYFTFAYSTCKCKLSAPTFKIDNVSVPYDTSSKRFTLNADGATFKHDDKCDIHSSNSSIDYSYSIEEDDDEICTLDGAKLTVHPSEPGKYAVKVRVTVSVDDISVTKDASFTVTKLTEDQTAELRGQDHKPYINGYEDSTFRPDNNLTRAEVSTMMVTVMGYSGSVNFESTFSDIDKKAWYFEDVSRMQYEGIFSGYEDGTFKPDNYITRAEFCVIIYNAMKIDSSKSSSKSAFTDVKGHWAEKYISALIQKKYISGYDAKTFMPDKPITRAEAVTIINRALDRSANKEKIQAVDPTNPYKDLTKSHWAYYEIIEASVRHYAKEWHK